MLIGWMLNCHNLAECIPKAFAGRELVDRTLDLIESGNVGAEMLTVTRSLSKPVGQYGARVAHCSAAVQLLTQGGGGRRRRRSNRLS